MWPSCMKPLAAWACRCRLFQLETWYRFEHLSTAGQNCSVKEMHSSAHLSEMPHKLACQPGPPSEEPAGLTCQTVQEMVENRHILLEPRKKRGRPL